MEGARGVGALRGRFRHTRFLSMSLSRMSLAEKASGKVRQALDHETKCGTRAGPKNKEIASSSTLPTSWKAANPIPHFSAGPHDQNGPVPFHSADVKQQL